MRGFLKRRLIILWVIGLILAASVSAQGVAPKPKLKAIMVLKPDGELAVKTDVLKGHLADLPVEFIVITPETIPPDYPALYDYFRTLAQEHGARIVFLAQFIAENEANLYVSLPDTGTTLVRHIRLAEEESSESQFELVAVIVRGIMTAMTSGGEIGVHIPEVPAPIEKETPGVAPEAEPPLKTEPLTCPECDTSPNAKPSMFSFRAGYGVGIASREFPWLNNFSIALSGRFNLFCVYLGYRVVLPLVSRSTTLDMPVFFHPISVGVGVQIPVDAFELQFTLAPTVNIVTWDISSRNEDTYGRKNRNEIWFALTPTAMMSWNFTHQASFYLAVSLDVYLRKSSFAINPVDAPEAETFLKLWWVSPLVQIGMRFGFGH